MNVKKLNKFCGYRENERIATPWSSGDFSYATNGFILVRVGRITSVPERTDTVNYQAVLDKNPEPSDGWVDAPGIEDLHIPECPRCKGKESDSVPCEECDGDGYVTLQNDFHDYECECKSCDGDGETGGCSKCGGTGYLFDDARVHIAGAEFKTGQILELTRTFGPLQIAPPSPDGKASWIKFKDGHALIMPIVHAQSA